MSGQPESMVAFTAEEQMDSTVGMDFSRSKVLTRICWYNDS
eukprot:CAMPEP_0195006938 /NCGR_PEP_ID=MMETSP0326_2-20130528/7173_1 /TAXON_ID=2866 ORGANISM="Crypthecodinium cohnii, Strain Seligo" /NCGR_SAMPLE_ID=MMETSP0326_2 /ASSEMBLY_ACC=CAM_ASM_000348 /LENGTH=40 /DNA_ID= /DNA_START= /DNA_END= /DNA_ORIENTATION=